MELIAICFDNNILNFRKGEKNMDSLKAYRDVKNSIDTALEKGREEGMVKGMEKEKIATARRLLSMGLSDEQVSTTTELPLEKIQKMRE